MNMNKEYVFPFSDSTEHSPEVSVDTFLWENNGYTPRTTAKLAINTEKLMLHMECIECKPLARFTVNGSPFAVTAVWNSSLLQSATTVTVVLKSMRTDAFFAA